jgi:hypothetical protein
LGRVAPNAAHDLLDEIAFHLTDYWWICEDHRVRVSHITQLHGPRKRAQLAVALKELLYSDLLAHLPYHLRGMKRILPSFIETLEKKHTAKRGGT